MAVWDGMLFQTWTLGYFACPGPGMVFAEFHKVGKICYLNTFYAYTMMTY